MKILMIGCEYSGTTTLAIEISKWIDEVVGGTIHGGLSFHDHWKIVEGGHIGKDGAKERDREEDLEHINFSHRHRQGYHHYLLSYHSAPAFFNDPHHLMIGMHIDDAIYGPRYFGYGGEGKYADRRILSDEVETAIMKHQPDTVLVLLKASPDVIRQRMKANPHTIRL